MLPPQAQIAFSCKYLSPNVLYEPSAIVNAGKPENFAVNSVTMDVNSGIYLVRAEEGYFALNAVCTHLGCLTAYGIQDLRHLHRVSLPQQQIHAHRAKDLRAPRLSRCHGSRPG